MAENKEKESSGKEKKISYLGMDNGYWQELQIKYQEVHPDKEFIFSQLIFDELDDIKVLRKDISIDPPHILFLDNSLHPDVIFRLTIDLQKDPATKHIILISLLPNLNFRDMIRKSLTLGIKMNFIKGIDFLNIIHHSFKLAFPKDVKKLELAVAKVEFYAMAMNLFNIGFVSKDYVHVETNFIFKEERELFLRTSVFGNIKLNDFFKVTSMGVKNLYTQYRRSYDLKFIHRDEAKIMELDLDIKKCESTLRNDNENKEIQEELNTAINERKRLVESEKDNTKRLSKKLNEWVINNLDRSRPKRSRILIVDRELKLLSDIPGSLEGYNFSVRIRTSIDKDFNVVEHVYPGIIAYVLEDPEESLEEENTELNKKEKKKKNIREYNGMQAFEKLIEKIKSLEGYNPFIILFNYKGNYEQLKEQIGYERMMVTSGEIALDIIEDMVKKYEEMHARNLSHQSDDDPVERRFFVSKFNDNSIGEYSFAIDVQDISESEIHFKTEQPIPLYATLYIKEPVKMTLTVVPENYDNKNKGKPAKEGELIQYYALISGMGEIETNNLRKYINELLFKELNEKRALEKEQFDELNKSALEEKDEGVEKGDNIEEDEDE